MKIRKCTAEEIYKMQQNNEFNHFIEYNDIFLPDGRLKIPGLVGKVGEEYIVLMATQ